MPSTWLTLFTYCSSVMSQMRRMAKADWAGLHGGGTQSIPPSGPPVVVPVVVVPVVVVPVEVPPPVLAPAGSAPIWPVQALIVTVASMAAASASHRGAGG